VYREGKDEYDIIARPPERDRRSIENLKRITVPGPQEEQARVQAFRGKAFFLP